jgi:branched-chain amino acid transport system permease protein
VRGALVGALLVGMTDALGRAYIPLAMSMLLPPQLADSLGAGLVATSVYILMALVLLLRPAGLLPARQ